MESNFKQFAAIASNWVPNNPVKAFLPFFYYYINKEVGNAIKIENFSKGLERVFGIHFPYHTILSTLNYLRSIGEARLEENLYWIFDLKKENKKIQSVNFNDSKSALLIESFKNYYPNDKNVQENAESILSSFFNHYDHEIMAYGIDYDNENQFVEYEYFVAKYIENLEKSNKELFDFVIQIAKGSIVKTTVLSDHYDIKFFENTIYYLDTKIVLFLLGYYGDYFKKEYIDFVTSLKSVGVRVYVTDYVVNEIESILRSCEKYVDSDLYRYEMSFDILRLFRKKSLTSKDVNEMIIRLEKNIFECGVEIENTPADFPSSSMFTGYYKELYEAIQNVYGYFERDEFGNEYRAALETDLRSIIYAYNKRNNNSITSIRSAKVFFVTTNRSLVRATNKFHEEKYKKTISPIATDDFIGVLLLGTTSNQSMPKIKILAFCNECFDLGDEIRSNYIKKIEELKLNNKITNDELFILKNSGIIDDVLLNNYEKNDFMISEKCVFDVLADIKEKMIGDLAVSYRREISSIEANHQREIDSLNKNHEKEMKNAEYNAQELKHQLLTLRTKPLKRIFIVYYFIVSLFGMIALGAISYEIYNFVKNDISVGEIVAFVFALITMFYSIFEIALSILKKHAPLYLLFKNHYDKKVKEVHRELFDDVTGNAIN